MDCLTLKLKNEIAPFKSDAVAPADSYGESSGLLPLILLSVVVTPVIFAIAKFAGVSTLSAFVYAIFLASPVTFLIIGLRKVLCKVFKCNG